MVEESVNLWMMVVTWNDLAILLFTHLDTPLLIFNFLAADSWAEISQVEKLFERLASQNLDTTFRMIHLCLPISEMASCHRSNDWTRRWDDSLAKTRPTTLLYFQISPLLLLQDRKALAI
jgi:hypothetical protein